MRKTKSLTDLTRQGRDDSCSPSGHSCDRLLMALLLIEMELRTRSGEIDPEAYAAVQRLRHKVIIVRESSLAR